VPRRIVFALLVAACVAAACAYVALAALDGGARSSLPRAERMPAGPSLLFRSRAEGKADFGAVELVSLDGRGSRRRTPLECERVYYAGGRGVCLGRAGRLGLSYAARIFGSDFRVRRTLPLSGLPSRTRVSADGRYGAVTTFVFGHTYADAGAFSTRTLLLDLVRGRVVADLEAFRAVRDGRAFRARDFNFWGVTFAAGGDRFYATLGTGGHAYLVEGRISTRTVRVVADGVECPSLSPDGTRVAFKLRLPGDAVAWRPAVLDLRTLRRTPLAETRGMDDQLEWLDDEHLLYGIGSQVWQVRADGGGVATRYLVDAASPSVVGA
jgi:hypothetical protein